MDAESNSLDDLRIAIECRDIIPYFQPIVELRSGQLWGFEMLSRWRHPQRGILAPGQFINLAENAGIIEQLCELTTEQTFQIFSAGFSKGKTLSINVAPTQMRDREVAEKIFEAAEKTGFPLDQLIVEITETSFLDNLETAIAIAEELKRHKVRIALDDFGTGYSTLQRLNSLPLDEIKIDQNFVQSMTERKESRKIVAAIVGLGNSLGLKTVAEGIETKEHADMLFFLGCELGQGYLYGKPAPADDVPAIMAKGTLGPSAGSTLLGRDMAFHLEASPAVRLAQLQAIYDGAPVGLCFLDPEFRYVSLNQRLVEMVRAPFPPRMGKTLKEVNPALFLQAEPYLKRVLNGEAISELEFHTEKPGSPMGTDTLLVSLQPVRDEAGEVTGISVAVMNITSRKQLEQAERDKDDYRRSIELNANYPFKADPEGNIVWVGPEGMTGVGMNKHLSDSWQSLLHPDDLGPTSRKWAASLHTGEPFEAEFRARKADGSWGRMHARASAHRGDNGEIQAWYGLVENIDDRKRTETLPG